MVKAKELKRIKGVSMSCPGFFGHTNQDTPFTTSNCIGLT